MSMADVREAKREIRSQLLQLGLGGNVVAMAATMSVASAVTRAARNVHAVGIGRKIEEGDATGALSVRVYVVQKLPKSLLSPRDVIPATIDGIPTDVVEAPPAFLLAKKKSPAKKAAKKSAKKAATGVSPNACTQQRKQRLRPVLAGISAGHHSITAGTIACFCRSSDPNDDPAATYVLSNNHVFANVNAGLANDPLYQPGPLDDGSFADHFADLVRFAPIRLGGNAGNRVDAAIGILRPGIDYDPAICGIGKIVGTIEPEENMPIRKHGRTTGLTKGTVDDIEYDALVGMDHADPEVVALFENQLRLVSSDPAPIGLGGDSGSLVVHGSRNEAVGLYFAGPPSGSYGVANRIGDVLADLRIQLA